MKHCDTLHGVLTTALRPDPNESGSIVGLTPRNVWMPPNRTQYENVGILKTHSHRNQMHLASRFLRELHVPFSGGNKQRVLHHQVKVHHAVIHYKGGKGVCETQEPRGVVR